MNINYFCPDFKIHNYSDSGANINCELIENKISGLSVPRELLAASCKPRVAESGEQLAVYFRGSEYYLVRRVPRRRAVLLDRVQHIRNKQGTENMI